MKKLLGGIDRREVISSVVMLLYTSYFFTFYGIIEYIMPNAVVVGSVLLIIVTGTFYLSYFRPAPLNKMLGIEIILCILVILFNRNANFARGNYGGDLGVITAFLFLYFSVHTDIWHKYFVLFSCIWTMIHTSVNLLDYLFPELYLNHILPLFAGSSEYDSLKRGAMNGYMAGFGKTFASNAMYLAVGFLILAILFLMGRKRKAVFLPLALTFLMLMITGIKSLMFFPLIGVAAVYFLNHSDTPKKTAGKIACFLLGLLIISSVLSLFIPQLRIVVIRVIRAYERGDVTNGRIHLYKTAFSLFLKHPLFGIGWYEFMYYYLDLFGVLKYVHNVYLQLLTENGILLSLPFFALFFSGYVRTVRAVITLRRDMKPVCDPDMDLGLALSVGMQTFFLLYCMTGNALNNLQVFYPYMCCLSIGEFYTEKLKQKNAQLSGCANETIAVREINP